jgi:hypothetical protein
MTEEYARFSSCRCHSAHRKAKHIDLNFITKSKSSRRYQTRPIRSRAIFLQTSAAPKGNIKNLHRSYKIREINLIFLFRYLYLFDEAIFTTFSLQRRVMGDLER